MAGGGYAEDEWEGLFAGTEAVRGRVEDVDVHWVWVTVELVEGQASGYWSRKQWSSRGLIGVRTLCPSIHCDTAVNLGPGVFHASS